MEQAIEQAIESLGSMSNHPLGSLDLRAEPDAQATVTDFLDFTEYLPSDLMRSLTLIGKLDSDYSDASANVHHLASHWVRLPNALHGAEDPTLAPAQLRADISRNLSRAISSRVRAHAESVRMSDTVKRHYYRAETILSKLVSTSENYPAAAEEQAQQQHQQQQQQAQQHQYQQQQHNSPIAKAKPSQPPRGSHKIALRLDSSGPKVRRQRVPRITVPGEVLAPYELNYDALSDDSASSSGNEVKDEATPQQPPGGTILAPPTRIKIAKSVTKPRAPKTPKPPKPTAVATAIDPTPTTTTADMSASAVAAANANAPPQLPPPQPPTPPVALVSIAPAAPAPTPSLPAPDNPVPGSAKAPWCQLLPPELARLRKRMKKNAAWVPSETMIARELKNLGRGPEAFRAAKQKAEEEGTPFNPVLPMPIVDPETGAEWMPLGSLSVDAVPDDKPPNSASRPARQTQAEARRLRRTNAERAAEEAEVSARNFRLIAASLMSDQPQTQPAGTPEQPAAKAGGSSKSTARKRKRDGSLSGVATTEQEGEGQTTELAVENQGPTRSNKRTKTQTPHRGSGASPQENPLSAVSGMAVPLSITPVPLPSHAQDQSMGTRSTVSVTSAPSPTSSLEAGLVTKTSTGKQPAETAVPPPPPPPPPLLSPQKPTAPILPTMRETRKSQAARKQEEQAAMETLHRLDTKLGSSISRSRSLSPLTPAPTLDTTESQEAVSVVASHSDHSDAGSAAFTAAASRRPASRGQEAANAPAAALPTDTSKQEMQAPLATATASSERPQRRTSIASSTPAPERADQAVSTLTSTNINTPTSATTATGPRPTGKRARRPAPGIVNKTNDGGNSAVGRRKAAPKKKKTTRVGSKAGGARSAAAAAKEASAELAATDAAAAAAAAATANNAEELEVEVDDEGMVIDPNEPRYCLCNRVSYGTMILCDNDNCKYEWFHLECVSLTALPARTAKWYCPECRVKLGIGEKGEGGSSTRGSKS